MRVLNFLSFRVSMSCILAKRKKVAFVLHAIKGNQIYLCQSLEFKKICTKTVTFQKSPNKLSMFCFFFPPRYPIFCTKSQNQLLRFFVSMAHCYNVLFCERNRGKELELFFVPRNFNKKKFLLI